MKNIFKILSVALVALATFVSAGCSCALNDRKIVETVRALETTTIYQKGTDLQNFTMTVTTRALSDSTVTVYNYDASNLVGTGAYMLTKTVNDVEEPALTKYSIADDDVLNEFYNEFKTQPINAYGDMTNGKYSNLIGLHNAADSFLSKENISIEASKKLFKDEITFVIEYRAALVERYRQTIVLNGDYKITSAKLEMIGTYVVDTRGNTEERVSTLTTLTITYK
jgi:hypothetical protein